MSTFVNYTWPKFISGSSDYTLKVNGEDVFVHTCPVADYATFSFEGEVTLELTTPDTLQKVEFHPFSKGMEGTISGNTVTFSLSEAQNIMLKIADLPELFIYANPLEVDIPDPDSDDVIFFKAGQVYDVGRLTVDEDDKTIYVEGGAILKGAFNSLGATNITLRGRGIMDASFYPYHKLRMIVFEGCKNVKLEGIITVGTPAWNTVFGACEDVHVDNYKTIGWVMCSDGIDIVGSKNVLIENCCLRCNDDCIVIKSVSYSNPDGSQPRVEWRGNVENVEARNCVLYNDQGGNALEIGFETQADSIRDIRFINIDILYAHGMAGVFTIHNGDRAVVEDVLYKDIRVEHYYDKLVDLRVMHSRYSIDTTRGKIRNIKFENIKCVANTFNTISLFGGMGDSVAVENVSFDGFYLGDELVKDVRQLEAFVHNAENITFK